VSANTSGDDVIVFGGGRRGARSLSARTMVATAYPDGHVFVANLYTEVVDRCRAT
jgi:hypothetical protein